MCYTLLPVGLNGPLRLVCLAENSVDLHFDHLANVNARLIGKQTEVSSLQHQKTCLSPRAAFIGLKVSGLNSCHLKRFAVCKMETRL